MRLFSADATIYLKKSKNSFAPENCSKMLLIIGPNCFFSIANQPKNSPNSLRNFYIMTLFGTKERKLLTMPWSRPFADS